MEFFTGLLCGIIVGIAGLVLLAFASKIRCKGVWWVDLSKII